MNEDWSGLAAARAVWDFTISDPRRFLDRLELVIYAAEDFRQRGIFSGVTHGVGHNLVHTQIDAKYLYGIETQVVS